MILWKIQPINSGGLVVGWVLELYSLASHSASRKIPLAVCRLRRFLGTTIWMPLVLDAQIS